MLPCMYSILYLLLLEALLGKIKGGGGEEVWMEGEKGSASEGVEGVPELG
jgi:hypothetical protein